MTRTTFSAYRLEKLSAYVSVQPGYAFASEKFTDDPSDCPLVKGENVQQGYVDWGAAKYWPQTEIDDFAAYELRAGDVVVAMDRPWVQAGLKWAYIRKDDPRSLLVQRVARLTARDGLDQTYLRCLISSAYFAAYVQPIVTGVNVPHISGKQIGDFLIPVPDLPVQRNIAAILAAYDDLIANNQRRIALLEGMAEEIYREWFVRMRFPGHEACEHVGLLPRGWVRRPLGEITSLIKRGVSPDYADQGDGIVLNQKCIRDGKVSLSESRHHQTQVPAEKYVQYGDVLINSTGVGTLGRVAVYDLKVPGVTCDSHVTILRPNSAEVQAAYLAPTVALLQGYFESLAAGSTGQSELSRELIARTKVVTPSEGVQKLFAERVTGMMRQRRLLQDMNTSLAQTRDALLPRLISGKLKVDHLDIRLTPNMRAEAEEAQSSA